VGGTGSERRGIERQGFAATYTRGLEIVMQTMAEDLLQEWTRVPIVLVRPRVERVSMFAFNRTPFLIAEGFRALNSTLDQLAVAFEELPAGIHPQRRVELSIDEPTCICCGICYTREPQIFGELPGGKAFVREPIQWWTPLGDRVVRSCPTGAIIADRIPSSTPA